MKRHITMLVLLLAATLVAAACDGASVDDDFGPDDSAERATTAAPETTAAPTTTVAASSEVDQAALDEIATQVVADFGIPGAVIQLRVDGQDPTTSAAGFADVDGQQALTDTDQLRIYSTTKAVTATIALQLAEEGVLTLDDPVTQWLTDDVVGEVPDADQMTVRQLLNHSSGAVDYLDTMRPGDEMPPFIAELFGQAQTGEWRWYSPQDLIDFSTQFEPPFPPGDGTAYSNTGYVMVGLIIEKATGNSLQDEMSARVFEPLGLDSTYLETPTTPNDYAPGYQQVGNGQLVSVAGSNASFAWAAGGIISDVHDFGRLVDALFSGELLSPESHDVMFTFERGTFNDAIEYGMGVYRVQSPWGPLELIEGGAAGYTASALRIADENATVVGMFNRDSAGSAFEFAVEKSLALIAQ